MKTLQKIVLIIVLITITLFASSQINTDIKQILSKPDTRKEIMEAIANDSIMSKEMMETMMNNKNCKMMTMENHDTMMKMMKDNPGMMQSMMSDMMEICKSDTSMMSSMCKTMMENQQMKEMMQKKMGENKDMKKMEGMNELK